MSTYKVAYTGAQVDTRLGYAGQDVNITASPTFEQLTCTKSGDQTTNFLSTGTATQAYVQVRAGDGATSSRYAGFYCNANESSPRSWYMGMYGDQNFVIRNHTTNNNYFIMNGSGGINLPAETTGRMLSIDGSNNVVSTYAVDQSISTTATPQFARIGIGIVASGTDHVAIGDGTTTCKIALSAGMYIGTRSTHNFIIQTDNTTAVTVDTSQNMTVVGQIKSGDGTNFATLDDDGLRLGGTYTCWEDLKVPLQQGKQGSSSKPDYNYTELTYDFPQNDSSEALYFNIQMPHGWLEGSDINPHVHWIQTQNLNVTWKIDYRWYNPNSAVPASWTTVTIDQLAFTYSSGSLHQISKPSSMISGTGKTLSSILQVKLYRDDNVYTGDALALEFDIHYEVDAVGSGQEFLKDN